MVEVLHANAFLTPSLKFHEAEYHVKQSARAGVSPLLDAFCEFDPWRLQLVPDQVSRV